MKDLAQSKGASRLRIVLYEKGITAKALGVSAGLSESLVQKVASNRRRPSFETVEKIEAALSIRIWSSSSEFKARHARAQFEAAIKSIIQTDGIDEKAAREIAASRFPHLAEKFLLPAIQNH